MSEWAELFRSCGVLSTRVSPVLKMAQSQQTRLEFCFSRLLQEIGDDPTRVGLERTALLAGRAFAELTQGYEQDPAAILRPERCVSPSNYQGTVQVPSLPFMSLCEHTFLPFLGTVSIAYEPGVHIVGAGAFEKVIKAYSKRLQLQERLTAQIADLLFHVLEPKWVAVQIQAVHCCMNGREMKTEVRRSQTE